MTWRKLARYVIAPLAVAILVPVGVLWYERAHRPLRIGGVLSLTGAAHYLGGEVRDGAQMAIDEINAWGGLNGRRLELIVQDSGSNPETGRKAFRGIESKYHPLFYISTSSTVTVALVPLAEEARAVLVGLVVTTPAFPGPSEWAFRFYPTAEDDIAPIIPILKALKIGRIGTLHVNDEFGSSIFRVLQREFGKIGGKTFSLAYPAGTDDFAPYFRRLESLEAVYLNGFIPNLAAIYGYLEEHPVSKPLFSNNASTIPQIRTLPGASGVYTGAPVIYNEGFVSAAEVWKEYESTYQKPFTHYAANGYDFIRLITGLMEGHESTREQVRASLGGGFTYPGILGELSAEPGARSVSFPLFPARIVEGKVVYLNLDIPTSVEVDADPGGERK